MMKLEKLEDTDGRYMNVFLFIESTADLIPVNSFVFDYVDQETTPQDIINKFVECLSKGETDIIESTIYTPYEISNTKSHATKFLRQLRRDLIIGKLL